MISALSTGVPLSPEAPDGAGLTCSLGGKLDETNNRTKGAITFIAHIREFRDLLGPTIVRSCTNRGFSVACDRIVEMT